MGFSLSGGPFTYNRFDDYEDVLFEKKKDQGYNDRLDDSLGEKDGKESSKEQSEKDRRDESEGEEKSKGKKKRNKRPTSTAVPIVTPTPGAPGGEEGVEAPRSKEDPPDEFVCPITQELMIDPVVIADGHAYERCAIETWLQRKATSPKTGQSLDCTMVFPNHILRRQIVEWKEG